MMQRMDLSREEKACATECIAAKTGYCLTSPILLSQVFRRSSFAAETGQQSNEILEFIGDQVLSFYVIKTVAKRCGALRPNDGYRFQIRENQFTQIKQELVSNEALAKVMDEWGLAKYLLLGKSDVGNDVVNQPKVKADLLEAIIGAIAIKSNWDDTILESVISKIFDIDKKIAKIIQQETENRWILITMDTAITTLKELAEQGQCTMPTYDFMGPNALGFDHEGNPKWACCCSTANASTGLIKSVMASSKKDAKKAAAYLVLCAHLNIQNLYGPNDLLYPLWVYKDGKLFPDHKQS